MIKIMKNTKRKEFTKGDVLSSLKYFLVLKTK